MMRTLLFLSFVIAAGGFADAAPAQRLNFVFIGSEDISPDLGCYGNTLVHTPNIDRLASEGVRFTRCFTHAPVCSPSRSGMITGIYPISSGTLHHRSKLKSPPRTFTSYLREAGYFVAWPGKTDFNFDVPADAFDSKKDWTRQPQILRQPFFAYINFGTTHESKIRASAAEHAEITKRLKPQERVDPAKVTLPPYYPDTPEVRHDVASYLENITAMDYQVGDVLDVLQRRGLEENTVIVFWGDHGWGMPRGKRWIYDSGSHCPLIIRWPGKIKPGTVRDDLVAVVDFAPTWLTLAGVNVPSSFQGRPMLTADGEPTKPPRKYVFCARDRMDETPDRIRGVRDERYQYIRNFHPELPYAQRVQYGEMMPTMQAWRREFAAGKLNDIQSIFFSPTKPQEELYDTQTDPHEVHNLAGKPEFAQKQKELRNALDKWIEETGDLGAIDERDLIRRGLVEDAMSKYDSRKEH